MRRFLMVAGLVVAVATPASAQSDRVVRTFNQEFDRAALEAVAFDLNVGELEVVGASTDKVIAQISVRCAEGRDRERCRERAEDVRLNSRERRNTLYLDIEGTSMWRSRDAVVSVKLTVPHGLGTELNFGTGELTASNLVGDLSIEMDIGEVSLENLRGNLSIDMGVGEIAVSMPQDLVGEVTLDNGIGETELRHRDGRNAIEGILGGTDVHWDSGTGPHKVNIELNVGEIRVRLD
ncbi:MAG: hypothetical protein PVJ49_09900 [Acidobacteriota bacterium]